MGPTAPSCTQPPYPAEARHIEPRRTSAWAGSHRHHTSCLEGSRQTSMCGAHTSQTEAAEDETSAAILVELVLT